MRQDVIDCLHQRKEPLSIAQLSYSLKYRKAYLEELLPTMAEVTSHALNEKHQVYSLLTKEPPTQNLDSDLAGAMTVEAGLKAVESSLQVLC